MTRTLLVGDTHANSAWWDRGVQDVASKTGVDQIIQLGDFGWWPHDKYFAKLAARSDIPVYFLDGNHEHHHDLARAVAQAGPSEGLEPVRLAGNLFFMRRGDRLRLDGVDVVAVGGAHSIDRRSRTIDVDWFPEEHLSDADIARTAGGGRAEVMVSHDAPSGWEIPGLPARSSLPAAWWVELEACEDHRRRVRECYEAVEPSMLVHGHYHVGYSGPVQEAWGEVSVCGLDDDGSMASLAILTTADSQARLTSLRASAAD